MNTRSGVPASAACAPRPPPGCPAAGAGAGCCAKTDVQSTTAAIGAAIRRIVMTLLQGGRWSAMHPACKLNRPTLSAADRFDNRGALIHMLRNVLPIAPGSARGGGILKVSACVHYPAAAARWPSAGRRLRRLGVLDDEEHLARPDQAELLAGERLDRRRVRSQPPRFFTQPGVL